VSGEEFFTRLASTLARALEVHCAFVTEFTDDNRTVRPLAMWRDGRLQPEKRYAIAGTPCETVLNGEPVTFEQGVVDLFPDDRAGLLAMKADSFLAIPLSSRDGTVIGHIAIMDSHPRRWEESIIGALQLFAARATTEVERLQLERQLTESNRELEVRVQERTQELALANERLLRQIEHERRLSAEHAASEAGFRALFEHSPVAIWELDLTGVRRVLDDLRRDGVEDVATRLHDQPEAVARILDAGSLRRFNSASLALFRISNPQELIASSLASLPEDMGTAVVEMSCELARGNLHGVREIRLSPGAGSELVCQSFWTVPPDSEDSWSRLLVSFVDLTEQTRVSEALSAASAELEGRVATRTAELSAVNTRLRHEIARRASTERALLESEAAYRDLYENAPNVYWSTGVDGLIRRANARASELFGYSPEEFVSKPLFDLLADTPEGRDAGRQLFERFLEGRSTRGQEVEFRAADGRSVWADVNIEPIFDEHGNPVATRSVLTDVTARKQAEIELARRQSLDQMVVAVSTVLASVGAANIDEELPRVLRLIGERGGWVAVSIHVLTGEETSTVGWQVSGSERRQPAPLDAATIHAFRRLEGPRWWSAVDSGDEARKLFGEAPFTTGVAAPLGRGDRLVGVLTMVTGSDRESIMTPRDTNPVALLAELIEATITRSTTERELVAAKRLAESASKAKTDFLASMSHELRTPLNVILGYAQLLRRRPEFESSVQDHLASLQRSGELLLQLIDDVLELAKMDSGKITIDPRPIELTAFTNDLTGMFTDRIRAAGLRLEQSLAPSGPTHVIVDGRRLQQILINLIGNAVKFSRSGGTVTLSVSAALAAPGRIDLSFSVADQGIGIPASELEHVFEPFVQLGAQRGEGVGLGLAITRTLVTALGGDIRVTSEPGSGSIFTVTVPSLDATTIEQAAARPDTADGMPGGTQLGSHPPLGATALQELSIAADLGDVAAIEAWLERMTAEAPKHPLLARIREHLQRFDVRTIQRLTKNLEKET